MRTQRFLAFCEEMAQIADLRSTQFPAESVKPDGAEYVVRLISVKPMSVERLITLAEKWALSPRYWFGARQQTHKQGGKLV